MNERLVSALAAVVILASGCGRSQGSPADDEVSVIGGFYPLYEAAVRVGGDRVTATNLTPAGTEPHDLELTTRDVDAVLDARVILFLGEGFQPALEETAEGADGLAVDLLQGMPLREGSADAHGGAEDGHQDAPDPHVWLDPELMMTIVDRTRDALTEADPPGAEAYADNARAYREEIEELAAAYEDGLAECERRTIVTAHASFGYLAERYGLEQEPITGISPESEPDPRRLDELATLVEEEGVTTIFTERLVSPDVAETLAREVGVSTAVLDPIEGLTSEQEAAGQTYASLMRSNLDALREALGCA